MHQRRRQYPHLSFPLMIIGILSSFIILKGAEVTAFVHIYSFTRRVNDSNIKVINTDWVNNYRRTTHLSPLSMVTKSGGRLIASIEQFGEEVLKNDNNNDVSDNPPLNPKLPVLVLWTAPWCGPCRLTNPVVKEIMKLYQNKIEVVEINTDDLPEIASDAGVLSIPTIQLYYEGKVMDTIVGCVAKNVLARSVDKVLEDAGLFEEKV